MPEAPHLSPSRQAEHAARDKRLAEALRENLRRRKEQARAKGFKPESEPASEEHQGNRAKPRG